MTDATIDQRTDQPWTSNHTKFTILLVALVTVTLLHGVAGQLNAGYAVVEVTTLVVNAAGLYAVCRMRRHVLIGGALMLCTLVANLMNVATGMSSPRWIALDAAMSAALNGYFVALILLEIFDGRRIKGDDILGSICAYLLLAIFWASIYSLVQVFVPGAFAVGGEVVERLAEHRLVYFSFVTLSTLGYGDVTPAAPIVQDLAVLAAVSGVFYLATLVAVLVSRSLASGASASNDC